MIPVEYSRESLSSPTGSPWSSSMPVSTIQTRFLGAFCEIIRGLSPY